MSSPIATYSFLPWLRQGIANQVQSADFDNSVKVRPQVTVQLQISGDTLDGGNTSVPVTRPVALFGPGDIIGIDKRAIVRTEPRDWVTNFEPNYLAHIEFYDEDFPWRYTPAAPDTAKGRLRPWIAVIALTEAEFTDGKDIRSTPLPYIDIPDLSILPRTDELWAWAHVHVNRSLAANDSEFTSLDMTAVIPKLRAALNENPDLACSRILCPRKLAPNQAYHCFVVPVFESGRRAGLGLDLADVPATMSAWDPGARPQPQSFPYYFRWYFRTADTGDFETLVRLLTPKPVDPRVGFREMDVQHPGMNVPGVDKPELGGILMLGGALQPPAKVPPAPPDKFDTWDVPFPRPLQISLANLINLPDLYQSIGDPDPIITPPLYGRWHAMVSRVLREQNGTPIVPSGNWVHRLNLDPRFRVAAGLGTSVIQDQQEKLMESAWDQIGQVLEAQKRIRRGQFGLLVTQSWFERHITPAPGVDPQRSLMLMSPLNRRVLISGTTLHFTLQGSFVVPPMTSTALRRAIRPGARLVRSLPFTANNPVQRVVDAVNVGKALATPPKVTPPGVVTGEKAAKAVPAGTPQPAISWLTRLQRPAGLVFPKAPGFVITPGGTGGLGKGTGNTDSTEAVRLKQSLGETIAMVQAGTAAGAVPPRQSLDLNQVVNTQLQTTLPALTIPRRIMAGIGVPSRVVNDLATPPTQTFVEPMAYPVIDLPMYEPLKNLSSEYFLPNINLIEQNSITLLENNQRFIEAYMAGLNHEFARELLWREFPTDQRGSSFRQFWDVRGVFNASNLDDEALKESLRDIPPLHLWDKNSNLGDHNQRSQNLQNDQELVLVIRGELLKRYPNAVIYAHRACWQRKSVTSADQSLAPCGRSGGIDNTVERRFAILTPAEEDNPPRTKVLTPLYEAKVDPDIYFFGFDLTVEQARGGTGENPNDDPGWFFVIKERPGEPRFGLDTDAPPALQVWDDLSWPTIQPNPPGASIVIATSPATLSVSNPGPADEKFQQFQEDQNIQWDRTRLTAADLGYVLFRVPVLVGVHASEMLAK
jgi:hypothetical protein